MTVLTAWRRLRALCYQTEPHNPHQYLANDLPYVVARRGDTGIYWQRV